VKLHFWYLSLWGKTKLENRLYPISEFPVPVTTEGHDINRQLQLGKKLRSCIKQFFPLIRNHNSKVNEHFRLAIKSVPEFGAHMESSCFQVSLPGCLRNMLMISRKSINNN
jgi:hypothetical protein